MYNYPSILLYYPIQLYQTEKQPSKIHDSCFPFPAPRHIYLLLSHFLLASLIHLKHVEATDGTTTSRFDMFI